MRYTIRLQGTILGTYDGATEAAVLDVVAQEEGYTDFEDLCAQTDRVRDHYTVTKVQEG